MSFVTIIGAGLAGSEAALQLAARGHRVQLLEQKPSARTPAQNSDKLCELVCSNSFRGSHLTNAVGLLKEEMRRLNSQVMGAAELTRVPAGGALAVDREKFSEEMTRRLEAEPLISVVSGEVTELPADRPLIIATGPLTSDGLAVALERLLGEGSLAYYDAIAPIVSADTIDWEKVFIASRWDKGETEAEKRAYVNCPMDKAQYEQFVAEIVAAKKVEPREFEQVRYFEGCLPIEVMAERGVKTLAFGPMKPAGLTDPRTGRWPYAVVQLRQEDEGATAYNLVGFQSRMTWPEQQRIFRMIPGLENAEFQRFGAIHRNTFICAPRLLDETMQLKNHPGIYFAGQISGTEGYVESAAGGWLAAHFISERLAGREPRLPPEATAHAALLSQLKREPKDYQPSNITFSHFAPCDAVDARGKRLKKRDRYEVLAQRALDALEPFRAASAPKAELHS